MRLIIVGCGRVGADLALATHADGHEVTVVDRSAQAFSRLEGADRAFSGRTIQGEILHLDVLQRAGIETADGLAAVTPDDQTNFVAARMASRIFQVPNVVARVFDPKHLQDFELLGVQTVASSSWAARRVELLLTHPGIAPLASIGHGDVLILEVTVPPNLSGKPAESLRQPGEYQPISLVRAGKAHLVTADTMLSDDDLLVFAVTKSGLESLKTVFQLEE